MADPDLASTALATSLLTDDKDQDEEDDDLASAALLSIALEDAEDRRTARRNAHRIYLTHPQLLCNPRVGTPWQVLYHQQNDRAFITTMGFDCATFQSILDCGFAHEWDTSSIPRNDVHQHGAPRLGRRSLTADGALGLVLHYLNSTMHSVSLQEIFALIPTTVSRYLNFALRILLSTIRKIPDARICWPSEAAGEFEYLSSLIVARHPLLTGAFGFIDGLNLRVEVSSNDDIQNATYNGWLHSHYISNVFVFSSQGLIIQCVLNAPGSWHDSRVAKRIYSKLRNDTPDGYYVVADTAFPKGSTIVKGRIRTPMKQGARLPVNPDERKAKLQFNRALLSARQAAEWGMRCLQGSFGRLKVPLDIQDGDARRDLLEICARLHNLRTNRVGVNIIRSTYEPIWKDGDGTWEIFGDALLDAMADNIRVHDRVSRFHITVDSE